MKFFRCYPDSEQKRISFYIDMYKSYELNEYGEQWEGYCGNPALKVWAYPKGWGDKSGFFIGVGGIDNDDSSWLWETEVDTAEEQKRVFQGMVNFYLDIRHSLVSPDILDYFDYVILPQLSYLTGGKKIIYRGNV